MSGGVDSAVAAFLLKEQGYDVAGITFWLWGYPGGPETGPYNGCCAIDVAGLAAKQIGIPHEWVDESQRFKKWIVDPFTEAYLAGRTPNPCVRCNRHIRFGLMLEHARKMGFDYLATGHHARVERAGSTYYLKKGVDEVKDQSYVLYTLTQDQLADVLFPIGDYTKEEVRRIAEEQGLISAREPESQDLCFINGDYHSTLREMANGQIRRGEIVDLDGNVIGEHEGVPFYTIGQRRGLGVGVSIGSGRRTYVVELDPERNRVVVGGEQDLYATGLIVSEPSFVYVNRLDEPQSVTAKIRYRSPEVGATLRPHEDDQVEVIFNKPQRAVTPGQVAVFYQGDRVFGGGIIRLKVKKLKS